MKTKLKRKLKLLPFVALACVPAIASATIESAAATEIAGVKSAGVNTGELIVGVVAVLAIIGLIASIMKRR